MDRRGPSVIGQNLGDAHPVDSQHDLLSALVAWTEQNQAPEEIVATGFKNLRDPSQGIEAQRPLYPYPLFPHCVEGEASDPGSFKPVEHARGKVPVPADRYLQSRTQ